MSNYELIKRETVGDIGMDRYKKNSKNLSLNKLNLDF